MKSLLKDKLINLIDNIILILKDIKINLLIYILL